MGFWCGWVRVAEPLLPVLVGYVLAGGRSSRMGQDKAAMRLGGATLLELAVAKLRPVCQEVVVVGPGVEGVRSILDAHPGCGPVGGIEAALADCCGDWAAFLPVDMPLLPGGLLRAMVGVWRRDAGEGARVCFAVTEGRVQPLISMVHRAVLPWIRGALERGEFRVRPVLERAAAELADEIGGRAEGLLLRTEVRVEGRGARIGGEVVWRATAAEWAARELWFSNLNTPEEFGEAERLAAMWPLGEDGDWPVVAGEGEAMVHTTERGEGYGG